MGPCVQQRANKTVQIAQSIREVMGTQSAGISDLWDGRPGEGLLVAQQLRQKRGGDAEEPEACGALEAGRGAQGWVEGIRGFGVLEGGMPSQQSGTQEPRVVRATLYRGSGVGGWAVLTGVCTISYDQQTQGAEADVPLTSLSQERPMHVAGLHQCSLGCRGAGCACVTVRQARRAGHVLPTAHWVTGRQAHRAGHMLPTAHWVTGRQAHRAGHMLPTAHWVTGRQAQRVGHVLPQPSLWASPIWPAWKAAQCRGRSDSLPAPTTPASRSPVALPQLPLFGCPSLAVPPRQGGPCSV